MRGPARATLLRWPAAIVLAAVSGAPFLLTAVPPLTDVPGHLGRFAVQLAAPGDPPLHWFAFHWALTLNLGSDLVVEALAPLIGLFGATWLVAALTPVLTTIGLIAVARAMNPRGADALPWALLFVYSYPFLWGFLNFAFTMGFALIALAAWVARRDRRRRRAAIFLCIMPALLIGHGIAGVVAIGAIMAHDAAEAGSAGRGGVRRWIAKLLPLWPPVLALLATVIVWKAFGAGEHGRTVWLLYRKPEAVWMMLRDQNAVLDTGSVIASAGIWLFGWRSGARYRRGPLAIVLFVFALFLATPSLISGSDRIDTRLAPIVPMIAFALQDWSAVVPSRRRVVMIAGFMLLAVRSGVTLASFGAYDAQFRHELAALAVVRPGARIINLTRVDCVTTAWRSQRLEHLAALATPLRGAWVNAHWSITGLQLLQVRYSPSAAYDRDPSQLIWPDACIDRSQPFAARDRHALAETLPRLPLDRVDYLWLIGERLPAGYADPRLHRLWSSGASALYAVR